MKVYRYNAEEHYIQVCDWAKARGIAEPLRGLLPDMGRIVPGVAVVFLYRTDSKLGFIENLISNPVVKYPLASEAIEACIEAIQKDAIDEGITHLWGVTFIPGVADRAKKQGFSVQKERYKLVTKRLV